jgi:hypothetical protein
MKNPVIFQRSKTIKYLPFLAQVLARIDWIRNRISCPSRNRTRVLYTQSCFVNQYITGLVNTFLRAQRIILKYPCCHVTAVICGTRMRRKWRTTNVLSGHNRPQTPLCWCTVPPTEQRKCCVRRAQITRTVNSGLPWKISDLNDKHPEIASFAVHILSKESKVRKTKEVNVPLFLIQTAYFLA